MNTPVTALQSASASKRAFGAPVVMKHSQVVLRPDPSRTMLRPFLPQDPGGYGEPGRPRGRRIAERVLALGTDLTAAAVARATEGLGRNHRDIERLLRWRYDRLKEDLDLGSVTDAQALLLGAYFSEEYAFESAALFNPSIVLHPDQGSLPTGAVRFILSLRGIGEGHVSSVTFRTGVWAADGDVTIDTPSTYAIPPVVESGDPDGVVRLLCDDSRDVSETVLFPVLPRHRQGIEDARFVRFVEENGAATYYGTATAFSGAEAQVELIVANDLKSFELHPLRGAAVANKGMALFPRKVNGSYAMLGRQDSENIWFMASDDLFTWETAKKILAPKYLWEFVQMGNCGSPIEIDEGWLVITHGVGPARNYSIGACLLDKDDPTKVLGRLEWPLVEPEDEERAGYVPNVVYSCGSIVHGRQLYLPYAIADTQTKFATGNLDDILKIMN